MAIIYSYPQATPKASDFIIGTVTYDASSPNPERENPTRQFKIAEHVLKEINERLNFLLK